MASIHARALVAGKSEAASAYAQASVESVTINGSGKPVTLSLRGLPDVTMTNVKQIS